MTHNNGMVFLGGPFLAIDSHECFLEILNCGLNKTKTFHYFLCDKMLQGF